MSGYFDALDRAARGLPGIAAPRPRARFEDDGDTIADEPGFEEMSAPGTIAPPTDAPVQPPARPEAEQSGTSSRSALPIPDADSRAPATDARPAAASIEGSRVAGPIDASAPRTEPVPTESVPHAPAAMPPPPAEGRAAPILPREPAEPRDAPPPPPIAAQPVPVAPAFILAADTEDPAAPRETPPSSADIRAVAIPARPAPDREPAGPPHAAPEPHPAAAPLVIDIGHIDIRIVSEAVAAAPAAGPRRREPAPLESLADYLKRRSGAPR